MIAILLSIFSLIWTYDITCLIDLPKLFGIKLDGDCHCSKKVNTFTVDFKMFLTRYYCCLHPLQYYRLFQELRKWCWFYLFTFGGDSKWIATYRRENGGSCWAILKQLRLRILIAWEHSWKWLTSNFWISIKMWITVPFSRWKWPISVSELSHGGSEEKGWIEMYVIIMNLSTWKLRLKCLAKDENEQIK